METLLPLLFVFAVNIIVEVVKVLQKKFLNVLGEKGKDIVFTLLASLFVALGKVLGLINLDWAVVLPLLFAPQGVFVAVKKLLGK